MYPVAAALVAIAIAAPAFAADRNARSDEVHQADGPVLSPGDLRGDPAADAAWRGPEEAASSPMTCRERSSSRPSGQSCQRGQSRHYDLRRNIDWTEVGPSTDDFTPSGDSLRLEGARLVGTFKF